MSVRLRKWTDGQGRSRKSWCVDVQFSHADGRTERVRMTSPVPTRAAALLLERKVRRDLMDGVLGPSGGSRRTLAQFSDDFLVYSTNNNKPSAVYAKRITLKNHLLPAFGAWALADIGTRDVERYKASKLAEGLSPKSINNHLAMLRKLLNLAVEYGELAGAPRLRALRLPPLEFRFLEFSETDRLLESADQRWRPMLAIAVRTGLRLGELLALKWEDVDLVAGRIIVRRTLWQDIEGTPKGGRQREVPLCDSAITTFSNLSRPGEYVFCTTEGERLSHSKVKDVVPRACRMAGLAKRLTWHDLRHTFASQLVMRGVALKAVQELLGHVTIDMTIRYAHLSPDFKRDAVRLLDHVSNPLAAISSGELPPEQGALSLAVRWWN